MHYLDANKVNVNTTIKTDICIIGAGAAGITLAHEFDKTNLSVTILEAGGIGYEPELQRDYTHELLNWSKGEWENIRVRQLGGSTEAWYGRCTLLQPHDFVKRDWVKNSGWPITFNEVDTYIDRALDILKIQEPKAISPSFWKECPTSNAFDSDTLSPKVFLWSEPIKMIKAHGGQIWKSSNISILYYAFAQELIPNEGDNHINSIAVKSSLGNSFTVDANTVILAGGGIENSRLLMLSQTNHSSGIGNQHDNVGRYLMDHPRLDSIAKLCINFNNPRWKTKFKYLSETLTEHGKVQIFLSMSEEVQRREQLLNHATVMRPAYVETTSQPYLAAKRLFYATKDHRQEDIHKRDAFKVISGIPRLFKTGIKKAAGLPLTFSHLVLIDQLEQEPDRESRILLNDQLDRFGQQKTTLKWEIGESTTASLRTFHRLIDSHLRKNKLGWLESEVLNDPEYVPNYTEACHPTGTTRMSDTPQAGVVDKNCRVFGFDNLFIAGSSIFPTVSYANPTLSLVALAVRLADHIKAQAGSHSSPIRIK